MAFRSIPRRFLDQARTQPDAPAYAERIGGAWRSTDWKTFVEEVLGAGQSLAALGCEPGVPIGIMGFNCPSWTIADLAAMSIRAVPVGVYTSCSAQQAAYILGHAGARIVFVGGNDSYEKVREIRSELPALKHIVFMRGVCAPDAPDLPDVLSWADFLEAGAKTTRQTVLHRLEEISESDLGALIYTSGTTGPPKGSMLSQGALSVATDMGIELLPDPHIGARLLSYLPMAHAAERALTLLGSAAYGYMVYYAESIEAMPANLKEVQPHLFFGVPRVWEKIHAGLSERGEALRGPKRWLFGWARATALRVHELSCNGRRAPRTLAWRHILAKRLVLDRIRTALGLAEARVFLSGAAPLGADVLRYLASVDMPIREVYGQTEGCGPTSNNRPGETRWGSVGRPFRGCEVRIAADGEILVRGGHLFDGYFLDPQATAEVLRDGWLHSGDLGEFDRDGFLYITGRKKDILITAGGKNIAPRTLEAALKEHPLVEEAVLVGDRRPFLGALVTLRPEVLAEWAGERQIEVTSAYTAAPLLEALWTHVTDINRRFSKVEQIKRLVALPVSFTIEAGELTPTLKVRRMAVVARYSNELEAIYAGERNGEQYPVVVDSRWHEEYLAALPHERKSPMPLDPDTSDG